MQAVTSSPIRTLPPPSAPAPSDFAVNGPPVPALDRLRLMSPVSWTDFVLEWAHSLKTEYEDVQRCDGAGDMGRDVIAFVKQGQTDPWDNHQCKYYDHPLMPGDVWMELGKLCYYTYLGVYSWPRAYRFVSPQGAGPTLSSLVRSPDKLRDGLIEKWDEKCRKQITSTKEVALDDTLLAHIRAADFSIFSCPSPLTILEQHKKTGWHTARFGGGLPQRPPVGPPPASIDPTEANYVRALLDAYEERAGCEIPSPSDLADPQLIGHFKRSRREFYTAESLKAFSRDNVPPGTFEALLDDVHNGVSDVLEASHQDAYERVLATVKHAKQLSLAANLLFSRIASADKGGMCHQLANEERVKWKK